MTFQFLWFDFNSLEAKFSFIFIPMQIIALGLINQKFKKCTSAWMFDLPLNYVRLLEEINFFKVILNIKSIRPFLPHLSRELGQFF